MSRLVYGINPVMEALKATSFGVKGGIKEVLISSKRSGAVVEDMKRLAKERGIKIRLLSNNELESVSATKNHQGVVLVLKGAFPYLEIEDLMVLWKKAGERAVICSTG